MAITLHPTAFAKDTRKYRTSFIPKEESYSFVLELGANARIRCVNWPKDIRIAPIKHSILARTIGEVCNSDNLLPLTCSALTSVEPQMIAEHREFLTDDTFLISRNLFEPVVISGRSIVHVAVGKTVAVNKLAEQGAFLALAHDGRNCDVQEYLVEPYRRNHKCISLSVWEQPYRVHHLNARVIAENGLLLG